MSMCAHHRAKQQKKENNNTPHNNNNSKSGIFIVTYLCTIASSERLQATFRKSFSPSFFLFVDIERASIVKATTRSHRRTYSSDSTTPTMPIFHAVMFVDECENIERIAPAPVREWGLRFACSSCSEESPNYMYINENDFFEREGGSHHFVSRCKQCKNFVTVDVLPVPTGTGYYSAVDEKAANVIASFEVRGGQPTAMEMNDKWVVVASSGATFTEVDLSEDWCDYDESGQTSVTISGVTVEFEKPKKVKN